MSDHSKRPMPLVKRIPVSELRQLFDYANYWERAQKGEFHKMVISRHIPDAPNEPIGTESQLISIRQQNGFEVARIHAYMRPDGEIGASGKPDPKIVYDETGNVLYMQEKKK
jgi:hypothetical protein